ncbi:MAG: hypothetical protein ABR567_22745 [Myxococcales bacterium]|nr:hypothetical protein [Myxococcales bacterium]
MPAIALAMASGILPGCGEKLVAEDESNVQLALPAWPEKGQTGDAAHGSIERRDGRGSRVRLAWDVDARPSPVTEDDLPGATQTTVAGHTALLKNGLVTWRCEKSKRLFRLETTGPRAPEIANLAAHVRCHAEPMLTNGDVPAAATSVLGPQWRFGARGRGSISWTRDDAVLTFFAAQQAAGPRDPNAARKAAPAWIAAAGLTDPAVDGARETAGPQSHPALEVRGSARLEGQPVHWAMLFWRCLQRQRSYAAIVFSQTRPDENALLSARCHG